MCFEGGGDETFEQGEYWHLWCPASIRAIIACARARDSSDDYKLRTGLALVGTVGKAGEW